MTIAITGPHPYADKFPMLPEGELVELADSIRTSGLRQPVVITPDGLILDGRNRAAACELVGIIPETVVYEGHDLAEYVIDCNTSRRHMSTGARAMATALVLAADGRRGEGRWRRGSVLGAGDITESRNTWKDALRNAGVVLDFAPDLADAVIAGTVALDAAYQQAKTVRDSAERDKIMEREQRRREREQAAAAAERDAKIVADLTMADSHYVGLIEAGQMTPKAAWAAHLADTETARRKQREIEHGWRTTCLAIAEAVRVLRGGTDYARVYLAEFHPHADGLVPDGLHLTRDGIAAAIDFLTAIQQGADL